MFEGGKFGGFLAQDPEDGAAAGKAREVAGGFLFAEILEGLAHAGDVAAQGLAGEGNLVRAFEALLVVLHGFREVLFDRRRAGEGGGVEPAGHGDDGDRAEAHRAQEADAGAGGGDGGKEAQKVGPEDENANRDGDGIGQRREGRHGAGVVQQGRDAEIGVDARRHGKNAQGRAREGFQPVDMAFEIAGIAGAACAGGVCFRIGHGGPFYSERGARPCLTPGTSL